MARSASSRRQETLFIPFVEEVERDEFGGAQFAVKVRDGVGSKVWLTGAMPKRMAARRMREIREQMFHAWSEAKARLTAPLPQGSHVDLPENG